MSAAEIIKQIDELFGDTSVSPQETLDQLQEIRCELDSKIDCLEYDIKNNGGGK